MVNKVTSMAVPLDDPLLIEHVQLLLDSYRRWTGRELIPAGKSHEERARELFFQPFILLSHGTQKDPILNYGNQAALALWEMTWEDFTSMPSSLTAEPVNRADRARLLSRVARNGYIDDYRGVRISRSGRRFLVEGGTVWNILDANGKYAGQAATFDHWTYL
ncbi:MEKHLA domain protein [uncultured archaeon]|nr:MEKHLA domain protein [uncultured archaeon]